MVTVLHGKGCMQRTDIGKSGLYWPLAGPAQNRENDMLCQSHYHRGIHSSSLPSQNVHAAAAAVLPTLVGYLGCCLAGRLVVWLLLHVSVLHAHVVLSSWIAVCPFCCLLDV